MILMSGQIKGVEGQSYLISTVGGAAVPFITCCSLSTLSSLHLECVCTGSVPLNGVERSKVHDPGRKSMIDPRRV